MFICTKCGKGLKEDFKSFISSSNDSERQNEHKAKGRLIIKKKRNKSLTYS